MTTIPQVTTLVKLCRTTLPSEASGACDPDRLTTEKSFQQIVIVLENQGIE